MFLLDSLLISGIRWALETTVTAAEAEMNDDTVLREQLLEAEMKRELGEITDDDFAAIETDLLQRIREIKNRRDGGGGALTFGAQAGDREAGATYQVEAEVSGDFHEPGLAAETRIVTGGAHGGADVVVAPAAAPPARSGSRAPRRAASPRPPRASRARPSARPSRTGRS